MLNWKLAARPADVSSARTLACTNVEALRKDPGNFRYIFCVHLPLSRFREQGTAADTISRFSLNTSIVTSLTLSDIIILRPTCFGPKLSKMNERQLPWCGAKHFFFYFLLCPLFVGSIDNTVDHRSTFSLSPFCSLPGKWFTVVYWPGFVVYGRTIGAWFG